MYEFLSCVPAEELVSVLPLNNIDLSVLGGGRLGNPELMIFSIYGYDFLKIERARRLLLSNTDTECLKNLAKDCDLTIDGMKPYDMATQLAALPWTSGSRFPWDIARRLGIPRE